MALDASEIPFALDTFTELADLDKRLPVGIIFNPLCAQIHNIETNHGQACPLAGLRIDLHIIKHHEVLEEVSRAGDRTQRQKNISWSPGDPPSPTAK
jgi:hypothetical protein